MTVFEAPDYKQFIRSTLAEMPRGGRGQKLKLAELLGVHTTMIAHVLNADAHFSVEHGLKLAGYFGLTELETEVLIELIQLERAGDQKSRAFFKERLRKLREKGQVLANRVPHTKVLTEAEQAIFYSSWMYSAVRLATAIEGNDTPAAIADYLNVPLATVQRICDFLVEKSLLLQKDGRLTWGPQATYLPFNSTLVHRLHQNWRVKALQDLESAKEDELTFTTLIAISKQDFVRVREEFVQSIERFRAIGDPSPSEELCYLTIDWRRLR